MRKSKKILAIGLTVIICLTSVFAVHIFAAMILDGYSFELDENRCAVITGWNNSSNTLYVPDYIGDFRTVAIDNSAFKDDNYIHHLEMTDASYLDSIGMYAFSNSALEGTLVIPTRVSYIGTSAFEKCNGLTGLSYSSFGGKVSAQCFQYCENLVTVVLTDYITSIERYAFRGCTSLGEITIPRSVQSISQTAFSGVTGLVIYCYTDSYAQQYAEENGIDYVLLDAPAKDYFVGNSLSLNGDIGVNFYLDLTEDEASGAVVNFSWNVNDDVKTATVDLSGASRLAGGYKATCRVAPAEMTGDIHAQLLINGEKVGEDTYSAKQYADVILSDSFAASYQGTGARSYDNLRALVLNMLSFGSRAQTAFKVNLSTLADKDSGYTPKPVSANDITVTNVDMTKGLDTYGLQYVGSTLVCLTETTIRHYYKVTDQDKFDAVKENIFIGSKPASPVTKDGTIYFEISNIAAADLDRNYTLKIGNNAYKYSALHYIKTALPSDKVEDDVKKLIQVLYRYNQAANAYFAK